VAVFDNQRLRGHTRFDLNQIEKSLCKRCSKYREAAAIIAPHQGKCHSARAHSPVRKWVRFVVSGPGLTAKKTGDHGSGE
jgi:hypothetical protein